MKLIAMLAALAASAFALAGCGGDDSTEAVTTTETVATAPTDTTTAMTPDTTASTPTTAAPAAKVITIRVAGGVPEGGIQRPTVDEGDKVVLVVRTDSGEAVHLHGYNIEKEVVPGEPVRVPFTANIAGRFELELHPTDTLLAVIEVKP